LISILSFSITAPCEIELFVRSIECNTVHSSCYWGIIALLLVAVLTDSLKISFDYHMILGISRVHIDSRKHHFKPENSELGFMISQV